jgi:hypothetical protein
MSNDDDGPSPQFTVLLTSGMMLTTVGAAFMALMPWLAVLFPLLGVVLILAALLTERRENGSD